MEKERETHKKIKKLVQSSTLNRAELSETFSELSRSCSVMEANLFEYLRLTSLFQKWFCVKAFNTC